MKGFRKFPRVGVLLGVIAPLIILCAPATALPIVSEPPADVRISEINITGDEFVVLQNRGDGDAVLSDYWLGYTGSDTATATPSQQLPEGTLHAGDAIVLNNGAAASCGAVMVDKLSFSLANTAGTLALWHFAGTGAQASFGLTDNLSWGKAATGPAYLHVADEANVTKQLLANPSWYKPAPQDSQSQNWQVGNLEDCNFTPVITSTTKAEQQTVIWQTDDNSPPFIVLPALVSGNAKPQAVIPASDIGLKGLTLSEILPNPASPQTDAQGEFVELYNPNAKGFDLGGFKLQYVSTTSATTHTYTFPAGTTIAAKSFKAFFAPVTYLNLSNSGGQLWFVDPLNNTVAKSDPYGTAKDGQAWINAGSRWQWSALPTPNATNKLALLAGTTTTTSATVNGKQITAVKDASTAAASMANGSGNPASNQTAVTPVHPMMLVAVAVAALLYGAYEYRTDLANRFYQYRGYRSARRSNRG